MPDFSGVMPNAKALLRTGPCGGSHQFPPPPVRSETINQESRAGIHLFLVRQPPACQVSLELANFQTAMTLNLSQPYAQRVRDLGLRMGLVGTAATIRRIVELVEVLHDFRDDGGKIILRDKDGKEEEVI